jgi:hypothetical protein
MSEVSVTSEPLASPAFLSSYPLYNQTSSDLESSYKLIQHIKYHISCIPSSSLFAHVQKWKEEGQLPISIVSEDRLSIDFRFFTLTKLSLLSSYLNV